MHKILSLVSGFLACFFILSHLSIAQIHCGTVQADSMLHAQHPELPGLEAFELEMSRLVKQGVSVKRNSESIIVIPVVVHVVHNGETLGSGRNISDAQVLSQIKVMNEDFRRKPGTRGFNTFPNGADTKIEFELAKRTPQGVATNGITRWNATTMGWGSGTLSTTTVNNTVKPTTIWDPNQYLNIWVINLGSGFFGYAQFPFFSGLLGFDCFGIGSTTGIDKTDGVVLNHISFGSDDDGNFPILSPNNRKGKVTTHELGHYFGLRHIWGDGSCGSDFCEDTPTHDGPTTGCPTNQPTNNCNGVTNIELFQDYMDYSGDLCMNVFTKDQATRMRTVLENGPRRRELTYSPGSLPPQQKDASLASATMLYKDQCAGTAPVVSISVLNTGNDPLTSVQLKYSLNGAPAQTSDQTVGLTYMEQKHIDLTLAGTVASGSNDLVIWVEQSNGSADFASRLDTFQLSFQSTSGAIVPYTEPFETETFPVPLWSIRNPDKDCFEWRQQSVPRGSGNVVTRAYFVKVFNQSFFQGQKDQLVSPLIRVQGLTQPGLSFELAFANLQSAPTALRVFVSTNCGDSWLPNPVFEKAGAALRTLPGTSAEFIPNNQNQWRKENINLSAFNGQTIRLMFELESWGGNNFYLDNVAIVEAQPQTPTITAFNPASGAPGTTVTITGTNFVTGSLAFFNGLQAATTIVSPTQITAIVPANASTGYISVVNSNGTAVSDSLFIVNRAPTITYFSPASGQIGASVSIFGRDFVQATRVSFNNVSATFTVVSPTEIRATVPAGATTGRITVTNQTGTGSSPTAFLVGDIVIMQSGSISTCSGTYMDPGGNGNYPSNLDVVQTIRPGTPNSRISVRFTNFNTVGPNDYLIVYNGPTIFAPQLTRLIGNQTNVNLLSSHPTGALTFQFISNGSAETSGWEANITCLRNEPPAITSFAPDSGFRGSRVVILGSNFTPETEVSFNGAFSSSIEFLGGDQIAAIVPATATTGPIRVTTLYGSAASSTPFVVDTTVNFPTYCNVLQAVCGTSFITRVQVPGTAFDNSSACANNQNRAYSRYIPGQGTSATLLKGKTYAFQVTLSTATTTAAGLWIDFNRNGTFEASEYFGQQIGAIPTRTIVVTVPENAQSGWTGLRIRSRNGTMTPNDACINYTSGETEDYYLNLQINRNPIIESFTPNYGLAGSLVSITGRNFDNTTGVFFNGVQASFTINSATSLSATVPQGATSGRLFVNNPFGSDTSFASFFVTNSRPLTVLLLHSETVEANVNDVRQKLSAFGVIDRLDAFNGNLGTPSLAQLQSYDVVFVWNSASWQNRVQLGTNLASFIQNGGRVIKALYATAGTSTSNPGGTFSSFDLIPFGTAITSSSGIGTVLEPNHPIMTGVNSFLGGNQSNRPGTQLVSTGATRIANWLDNRPLIVAREGFPGIADVRKVDLGFYPPSSDVSPNNWVSRTGGARIMINAILWISNREALISSIPTFTDFNPRSGNEGTSVTLKGRQISNTNSVRFNGVEATYNVLNDSTVTTTVPQGATTGFIQLGTTSGASLQSPGLFLVGNELRMTNGSFNLCNNKLQSSQYQGAPTAGYADNEQFIVTIFPTDPAAKLRIVFNFFETESGYDFLTIFNGPTTASPLVAQYSGTNLPPSFTSTHETGALTFRFISDASITAPGWDAQLSCIFNLPTITSITPIVGQAGSPVLITGTGLSAATSVLFNGTASGATFNMVSPTQLLAFVPAGATTGQIRIVAPGGTVTSQQVFTVCNEFGTSPQALDTVSRCGPGQVTLAASGATGNGTYQWFASETATIPLATGATTNQNILNNTTFYVAFHNAGTGCTGPRRLVQVRVLPLPNASFSGLGAQYCEGDSSGTLLPVVAGGSFSANVTGNRFFATTLGTQSVAYTITQGSCTNTNTQTVAVLRRPGATLTANGNELTAVQVSGATYQWLLNGGAIQGANAANYVAVQPGLYRVVVRLGICADTSEGALITDLPVSGLPQAVEVFPNPFASGFMVKGLGAQHIVSIMLVNQLGQQLKVRYAETDGSLQVSVDEIPEGIYVLSIETKTGWLHKKVERKR